MKAVILAGGYGTRISEETTIRPKPMVEIGGLPILWHIMKRYSHYGINDFVICAGFKSDVIFEWFATYRTRRCGAVTFNLATGTATYRRNHTEDWTVTVVETGEDTMTGGRLKRVGEYVKDETFCMTYGDGVADIDVEATIRVHRSEGREATMTLVQTPGRFGAVTIPAGSSAIEAFVEKPDGGSGWINGGFFVLEPSVLDRIKDDDTVWELEPLRQLAHDGELTAYRHLGFWQPMDTLRDKATLENMWLSGTAPWRCW